MLDDVQFDCVRVPSDAAGGHFDVQFAYANGPVAGVVRDREFQVVDVLGYSGRMTRFFGVNELTGDGDAGQIGGPSRFRCVDHCPSKVLALLVRYCAHPWSYFVRILFVLKLLLAPKV